MNFICDCCGTQLTECETDLSGTAHVCGGTLHPCVYPEPEPLDWDGHLLLSYPDSFDAD